MCSDFMMTSWNRYKLIINLPYVVVHHQLHLGDIETSAGNIRGYQHLSVAAFEHGQAGHPLFLLPHAVQGGGGDADLCCTASPAEDDGGMASIFCFLVQQEFPSSISSSRLTVFTWTMISSHILIVRIQLGPLHGNVSLHHLHLEREHAVSKENRTIHGERDITWGKHLQSKIINLKFM